MSAASSPLVAIATLFDQAAVPYAVIGAHAVNVWVEPRFTADVDVTAAVDGDGLRRLEDVLHRAGWISDRVHGATLPSGPDFVRFVSSNATTTLEVQAAKTELQREVVRRAIASDEGVRVATPEDLIVLKLIADRPKDQVDLLSLSALPALDWAYVERWAKEWDVGARLARLRGAGAD